MILVDSSVWIQYFNGTISRKTDWLNDALGTQEIVVGDLILTEVLQGFQHDKDFRTARMLLDDFPFVELVGRDVAVEAALNYRYLRKKGVTVRKTMDILIGTSCICNGMMLLHDDRDFEPMERYLKLKTVSVE